MSRLANFIIFLVIAVTTSYFLGLEGWKENVILSFGLQAAEFLGNVYTASRRS